jgi:hypothetical protein
MCKRVIQAISLLALMVSTSAAFGALDNEDTGVTAVDVTADDHLYIHVTERIRQRPSCARHSRVIACSLREAFCKHALSVALAAHVSGGKIDYEVTTTCLGGVTRFSRLRVN